MTAGDQQYTLRNVRLSDKAAYDYFDMSVRFNVNDHLTLTGTVSNLMDKAPPIVGASIGSTSFDSGNTYPSTYDALGRRFAVTARIKL